MGSYVSIVECQAQYNIALDCSVEGQNGTSDGATLQVPPFSKIGGYSKGEFPGDPDIAGIGILGVFVTVTSLAIAIGILSIIWQYIKTCQQRRNKHEEEAEEDKRNRTSFSDILETLLLACSDQQVFTGAAYALALRYWRGCTISAYHYNIVANMMLLTCATHLVSVTVVRNYWRFPWLAILRVICITFVFIATGLIMTNQNADMDRVFPTAVPRANETDSSLFLPAACFQSNEHTAADTFRDTTSDARTFFMDNLAESTPRNKIQGWNLYIITLLFYGAATIAEFFRFLRRGKNRPGWRAYVGKGFRRCCGLGTPLRGLVQGVFLIYLLFGVGISCAVTILSAKYIFDLRKWVNNSGWIQLENNQNPENDAKSFGQLVPLFSSTLILFSFAQIISEKCTRHNNRKHEGEKPPIQPGAVQYHDPSAYDLIPPRAPEKYKALVRESGNESTASLPRRIDLESQRSWSSDLHYTSAEAATPFLGNHDYFSTLRASQSSSIGGRSVSFGQSVQIGLGSPPLHSSPLRTQSENRDTSPASSSSHSSGTAQVRSLIGTPNLSHQFGWMPMTPNPYSSNQPSPGEH